MLHIWNDWIPDMLNSVAHFSRAPEAAATWQCVNGKPAGIRSIWQACIFLLRGNTSESRHGGTNHYLPMMLLWSGGCVNASLSPPFYPGFLINTHFKLVQCTVWAQSTLLQTEPAFPGREVIDLTYIKIHIINSTALLSLIGFEKISMLRLLEWRISAWK